MWRGVLGDLEGGSAVDDHTVFHPVQAARGPAGTPDEPALSAGTLARRLGVATTTLRTWHQRYGLGPSGHEAGRHRRYTRHDIAALTTMARLTTCGVPAADAARMARHTAAASPAPVVDPGADTAARGLARAARRMDVPAMREVLAAAVTGHGVVHTWHTLAVPAFQHINRAGYAAPHRTVARRLLAGCLTGVFATVSRPPAGTAPTVLLVAADHPAAVTALAALDAALAENGIACLHLGAGLPYDAVTDAVTRGRPPAAVVWSHKADPGLPDLVAALITPRWQPTIVTAGPGWDTTAQCRTLADAVAVVAALAGKG